MRLRLLLIATLLVLLLLACGTSGAYKGIVTNKSHDDRVITIELRSGRTLELATTQEVFDAVEVGYRCTFSTISTMEPMDCDRASCGKW